jgi:hypothetical protein
LLARLKELQQSMGAPFSRILREGIIPMLEVTISILGKMGVIPIGKGQKVKLNNGQIAVKFASPLVQGQSLRDVEVAQQAMSITSSVMGDPMAGSQAVAVSYKVEDFGAWVGTKLGVDPRIMRNAGERETFQQNAAKVAAAAAAPSVGEAGGINQQQAGPPLRMAA